MDVNGWKILPPGLPLGLKHAQSIDAIYVSYNNRIYKHL